MHHGDEIHTIHATLNNATLQEHLYHPLLLDILCVIKDVQPSSKLILYVSVKTLQDRTLLLSY